MTIKKYLSDYKSKGYVLIPNLVSGDFCDLLKKKLNLYYKKYSNRYADIGVKKNTLADKVDEKTVYNMHNKSLIWFKLFENKTVIKILDVLLKEGSYQNKEPYYLGNISARCPLIGNQGQQLHCDSGMPGVNYNISVNVLWMLDDFTKENGATRIVTGSFKFKKYAKTGKKYKNEKIISGKKGSVIIFNPNLWHGSGPVLVDESRWGVILGYYRWFKKPSFDYMFNTPNNIYKKLSKKQKKLLGFDTVPPSDEFTRVTRRSSFFEKPHKYHLPR